jgi:glycosyltransferase involved in cell wall biosynthesis
MSVALLEAGGQAKPAVVTDVGANCEVVRDGVDGYVVPRGDKAGLAQALARLADDKQLLKKMGESFQARVRMEYSLDKMMSSYEAIYGRLWTG